MSVCICLLSDGMVLCLLYVCCLTVWYCVGRWQALALEVHQYKQRVETFSQLTHQLIASCQREDTRHIKRTMEQVNQRYGSLNARSVPLSL